MGDRQLITLREFVVQTTAPGGQPGAMVVGVPGAGKSTLLRRMAQRAWDSPAELGLERRHLPMMVRMRWLAGSPQTGIEPRLREALDKAQELLLEQRLPDDFFTEWPRRQGAPWLLLLDGWDEVPAGQHEPFQTWLTSLINHLGENGHHVIVTSRPVNVELDLTRWELVPLGPEDREQLGRNLLGERQKAFLTELDRVKLGGLDATPLLLTLAASVFIECDRLPARRVSLYEQFVEMWYAEARARGIGHDLGADLVDIGVDLLAGAAWQGLKSAGTTDPSSLPEASAQLFETQLGLPRIQARRRGPMFIDTMARYSGVLTRRGRTSSWAHQTFGEFLAAWALVEELPTPDIAGAAGIAARWGDPAWSQVVRFALGFWSKRGHDVMPLLRRVMDTSAEAVRFTAAALPEVVPVGEDPASEVAVRLRDTVWKASSYSSYDVLRVSVELLELSLFDKRIDQVAWEFWMWAVLHEDMSVGIQAELATLLADHGVITTDDLHIALLSVANQEGGSEVLRDIINPEEIQRLYLASEAEVTAAARLRKRLSRRHREIYDQRPSPEL